MLIENEWLFLQVSYVLPSNFEEVATAVLKVLNNLALIDVTFIQSMLVSMRSEIFFLVRMVFLACLLDSLSLLVLKHIISSVIKPDPSSFPAHNRPDQIWKWNFFTWWAFFFLIAQANGEWLPIRWDYMYPSLQILASKCLLGVLVVAFGCGFMVYMAPTGFIAVFHGQKLCMQLKNLVTF